jgi:hypothetical protein
MKARTSIRIFFLVIIASISLMLLASSRSKVAGKDCTDSDKCDQNQVQTEFIIWHAISHPLLGNR